MNGCAALDGAGVLVTRPADQADGLAGAVRMLGAKPVFWPGIEIRECDDEGALSRDLETTDLVVFVSRNAARIGAARIIAAGGLPAHVRVAAIGRGTETELNNLGLRHVIVPQVGYDSEALADSPALPEVRNRSILIVRGRGGRERLAELLTQRGARVRYAECYLRQPPAVAPHAFASLWQTNNIVAWTATSAEIVDNLFAMAAGDQKIELCAKPLFVLHARIAARAFLHGIATIFVTAPGDNGIAAGLATWFCRGRPAPQ